MTFRPVPAFAIESHRRGWFEGAFWPHVDRSADCWLWTGSANGAGRPTIWDPIERRNVYAYRVAWALTVGPIPADLLVCHHCDIPRCVRADHLFLGTMSDNSKDMWAKGRARLGTPRVGEDHHNVKHSDDLVRRARELAVTMSPADLAALLGIREVTLRDWVKGHTRLSAGGPLHSWRTAA